MCFETINIYSKFINIFEALIIKASKFNNNCDVFMQQS